MEVHNISFEDGEQLTRLLRVVFFGGYCRVGRINAEDALNVVSREFCEWFDRNITAFKPEECVSKAGVPMKIWDLAVAMITNQDGIAAIDSIWYDVILGQRPPLTHEVANVNVVLNITYADGKIATSQFYVDRDMVAPEKFTDGMIATVVVNNVERLVVDTVKNGLDALHDQLVLSDYIAADGSNPYDALMGAILTRAIPELPIAQQMAAMGYVRLIQRCIRPPFKYEKMKPAQPTAAPDDSPQGGWAG